MSSSPAAAPSKPKRRWLAFSLRALLVFTLLACLVAGYWGNQQRRVQRQRDALARLHDLGFTYEYAHFDNLTGQLGPPPGPSLGRALLGDDAYIEVGMLHATQPTADDFQVLADLPPTHGVDLNGDLVNDAVMEQLLKLRGLREVKLLDTSVTPAGFACLAQSQTLQRVSLTGSNIGDGAFAHLRELPRLDELVVQRCQPGLAGLQEIGGITQLKSLALYDCELSDDSLRGLRGLANLQELTLQGNALTDACIESIVALQSLEYLKLEASLTDEGFLRLAELRNLKQLSTFPHRKRDSRPSESARTQFGQARPDCNVGDIPVNGTPYVPLRIRK